MKRFVAAVALASALAGSAPGRAAPAVCAIQPGPAEAAARCEYVAAGPGRYVAATKAYWSVTVYRKDADGRERVAFLDEADADDMPIPLELPSIAGDRVVLTEDVSCTGPLPCGIAGVVAAFEPHP